MKITRILNTLLIGGALTMLLAAIAGCNPVQPSAPTTINNDKHTIFVDGLSPDWTLNEMVQRSDAIVSGTVSEALRTQTVDGPAPNGETPKYNEEHRDYKITVETPFYPSSGLPAEIAVMVAPFPVPSNDRYNIVGSGDIPTFSTGERVLIFLQSLDDEKFNQGPGTTAPNGFTKANYYRAIIAGKFAKLTPDGTDWSDTRSSDSVTESQIREAVTNEKGTAR